MRLVGHSIAASLEDNHNKIAGITKSDLRFVEYLSCVNSDVFSQTA